MINLTTKTLSPKQSQSQSHPHAMKHYFMGMNAKDIASITTPNSSTNLWKNSKLLETSIIHIHWSWTLQTQEVDKVNCIYNWGFNIL